MKQTASACLCYATRASPAALVRLILARSSPTTSWRTSLPCLTHWHLLQNAAYEDLVNLLNMCPSHNEGVVFAYLSDIHADPHYGFKVTYDDVAAPRSACVLSLVASPAKSITVAIGAGFQVTTPEVLDHANPAGASQLSVSLVGYCTMDALPGFRMDPPRGRMHRYAMCSITKREGDTFHVHKLEYIEPNQIDDAVRCFQKLRSLSKTDPAHELRETPPQGRRLLREN